MAAVTGGLLGVTIAYAAGPTVAGYLEGVLGTAVDVTPTPPGWLAWGMLIGIRPPRMKEWGESRCIGPEAVLWFFL